MMIHHRERRFVQSMLRCPDQLLHLHPRDKVVGNRGCILPGLQNTIFFFHYVFTIFLLFFYYGFNSFFNVVLFTC